MFQDVGLRVTILGVSQFRRNVSAVDRTMSGLNRSLSTMGGPLKNISRNLNVLGDTFISVGRSLTVGLTLPLAALTVGLVSAGISFEDAFSGVSKTVDGVADDFGKLTLVGEQIRKELVDLSLVLPISANELARVGQAAGQVGVSAENLLEFTEIAAKMGIATNIASDQAAIGLARVSNILGVSKKDFIEWSDSFSSAIVDLGNNVAASESEILNLVLRIAPMATVANFTTQEILGLAASLAEVGVRSERGGTAITRILLEMGQAADGLNADSLKIFAEILGITAEEFQVAFGEQPVETFKKFLVELTRFQEEGKLSKDMLTDLGLSGVRVIEVLNILGPNMGRVTGNIEMANTAWDEQTALQIEVQKKLATTASQLTLLKNAAVSLGIALFLNLKPAIDKTVKSIIEFIAEFQNLLFGPISRIPEKIKGVTLTVEDLEKALAEESGIKSFRKNLKRVFVVALVLGPALTGVGLGLKVIAFAFSGLGKVLGIIIPIIRLLFLGIFANPVVLVGILGIIAAVGAVYLAFKTNFLGITDLVKELWDSINRFTNIGSNLKDAFKDILSGDIDSAIKNLRFAWEGFVFWFQNFGLPLLKEYWAEVKPIIVDAISGAIDWLLTDGLDMLWNFIKEVGKALLDLGEEFINWVGPLIPELLEELGGLLGTIGDWIFKDALPFIGEKLVEWSGVFVDWVIEIWPDLTEKLGLLLEDILAWVIEVLPDIVAKLWEWTKAFFSFVIDVLPQLTINLATLLAYLAGWIVGVGYLLDKQLYTVWIPAFVSWVVDVWPRLKAELEDLWKDFVYWIRNDAADDMVAALESIGEAVWDIGKELGKVFIEGFSQGTGIPLDDILKITGDIEDFFNEELGGGIVIKQKEPESIQPLSPIEAELLGVNQNKPLIDALKGFFASSSSLNLSSVLGETVPGNTNNSNISNSSVFAPNISGVPMTNEESMEQAIIRAWRMAQVTSNG